MELVIDHVMFPVYLANEFLDVVEEVWQSHGTGKVFVGKQNASFKGIYYQSSSFYVEILSNTLNEPYWSNAVYVVVPKEMWGFYESPALVTEHFLIPSFGCGYQLVSPDFPNLASKISSDVSYDGFQLLISRALEEELRNIGGEPWTLPGHVRVHDGLHHVHDVAVINEQSKIIAPLLQPNPLLRDYL